ncbi:hypothetical protein Dimus_014494 [Dionaea muscipula]
MKRLKPTDPYSPRRFKLPHFLLVVAALYLAFITFKFPKILEIASLLSGDDVYNTGLAIESVDVNKSSITSMHHDAFHWKLEDNENLDNRYGRITGEIMRRRNRTTDFSVLERMADEAWILGLKAWEEVKDFELPDISQSSVFEGESESCPSWVSMSREELGKGDHTMFLPCGLAAGSSITMVGKPQPAHQEYVPQLAKIRNGNAIVLVSQFVVELQGLNAVQGGIHPKFCTSILD